MTETQATTPTSGPVFPPGRYGRRRAVRRTSRWLVMAGVVVLVAVALLVAWRLYRQYGDSLYEANVSRVTESTDTHVTVEFTVIVPSGGTALCTVRARAVDGRQIGLEIVDVQAEPGRTRAVAVHRLPTEGMARAVDVYGCTPR